MAYHNVGWLCCFVKCLVSHRLTQIVYLFSFSCMPYIACSSESTDGFCPHVDTTCTAANTCRTCDGSGTCREIDVFPNATVAEYGTYSYYTGGFGAVADKIKAEIYARGPGTYLRWSTGENESRTL
jgi:hypothetical protein